MRRRVYIVRVLVVALLEICLQAQDSKGIRVLGEVTGKNAGSREITVKPDGSGDPVTVSVDDTTTFLRIPPGETDLKKAAKITFADVTVGDRVRARTAGGPAVSIYVMTKSDLAQKQQADQAEWARRSVSGTVASVDPASQEVTINARMGGSTKSVVMEANPAAQFRRYAPDSIRFADAKSSSVAEMKPGDQVRILGDRNDAGSRIKPEMVVFGTFRNVAGTIKSIDAASGTIRITDLESKKALVVATTPESKMRRMPEQMANMLAMRLRGGAGAQDGQAPPQMRQREGGPPAGGMGPRGGDFAQMIERMPSLPVSELKPGDAVIVSSTAGSDPSKLNAIVLVAGVEPLLTAPRSGAAPSLSGLNLDINIIPQ